MIAAHGARRGVAVHAVLLLGVLLAWSPCAFALNPALDVSQYAHTVWRVRDGFFKGTINSVAQTPDGYLWLATDTGLLRFDGMRPVGWQPPPGEQLPSNNIRGLQVTRDGALWIGTERGVARWKDGTLTRYRALDGRFVATLVEDHDGAIWATTYFNVRWTLCVIRSGDARCYGDDGGPGAGAISLYVDRDGVVWAGTVGLAQNGLWKWSPGTPTFYPLSASLNGLQGFSEDEHGNLLVSLPGRIERFVDGRLELAYRIPASRQRFEFQKQLRDRDGGLWLASYGGGLVHVHQGLTDVFTSADGLSGDGIFSLFEDREGNIWVSTSEGLDRFREIAVATYSTKQGLSSSFVNSVLATADGSVWMAAGDRVNRWNHGEVTVYGDSAAGGVQSIFQDSLGRVWMSTVREVGFIEHGRYVSMRRLPSGPIRAIAEDSDANVWIASEVRGLFRVSIRTGDIEQIPWARLNLTAPASALAADRSHAGVWLGSPLGAVVHFAAGEVRASYGTADGLGRGRVRHLRFDRDGALWAATEGGVSRVKDGRVTTLAGRNGLPCDEVQWTIEDGDRTLWLAMACGLVRIARSEMEAWTAATERHAIANPTVRVTVFDSDDGVRIQPTGNPYGSPVVSALDGRLWFAATGGASVVDPHRLPFNRLPPPVHIEQVIADRKTYAAEALANESTSLPALTRDLEIDYSALSLVAPEKNQFRIKLEGRDRDWEDAGTRRQKFYTDLPPHKYRFRVMASNNSGVWNEEGAALEFSIAPAYYQTTWFRSAVVLMALAVMWTAYRFRLSRVADAFEARLQARVDERTRIARELHDTLLQSFHGLVFRLQASVNMLPGRPADAKQNLETAIDQAAQAITEGRDAVHNLRLSAIVTNDLAEAITALGEELKAAQSADSTTSPAIEVSVEGTARDIHPIVRDDIYRIAGEALRNAVRHAGARRIEVQMRYDDREFRLRVRDDGTGIDPAALEEPQPGHFGLPGMRERAELVGGDLDVWSQVGLGTEVELTIPAAAAYAAPRARGRFRTWLDRATGTDS